METRRASLNDLAIIMEIIESGRKSLKEQGLPQWQNGYGPTAESMTKMIREGNCYLAIEGEVTLGVGCLIPGVDDVYTAIIEGAWQEAGDYIAIHRFAVATNASGKGLGRHFLQALVMEAKQLGYRDVRIDTYPTNQGMIRVIESCGFTYRGRVHFPIPHGERVAYQLILAS